ncbi:acyltransferase [Candidatus Pantoea deserta]|uniref:Acyltransferase n=1 Tax=Candidatus Pantoea deserta TaxID=1869313 RepID=A0A3N4P939_9GAMM|nr:acyltransferase family protein [Pantoea deserta]RPE01211.1 acyltransferase [Pantoea deserta]
MNVTGLNLIKTLGCMSAVTFFTLYNTWDRYDYDYHWILAFLTFVSTIATPLFFVVAGIMDARSNQEQGWQLTRIMNLVVIYVFWMTVYLLWEPYQRGYLIQPWFFLSFLLIYGLHPLFTRLAQLRLLFYSLILTLLFVSYGYDLLSVLYPQLPFFSLEPQYRIWTWLLFYLTGQLAGHPRIADWLSRKKVARVAATALPFIYLFTWFYEQHFFFAVFKADRNAFILTGSQIYLLVVALVVAASRVRFRRDAPVKEKVLAAISKTMTGVYILHYSVFHLLTMFIPVASLGIKLALLIVTFVISVLLSRLMLISNLLKKVITL